MAALLLASTVSAQSTTAGFCEPLTLHPAQTSTNANGRNRALGQFGESLVRNFERVRGHTVFNLNVGEHGIDLLARVDRPGGNVEYTLGEIKTLQNGTDFQLNDTKAGKQLSRQWIEDRLATAATKHPDAATRKAAAEALELFHSDAASVKTELHGVSIGDNRYIVRAVDSATGTIGAEIASRRVTDILENLSERASSEEVRLMATRHLAEFDQLQAASNLRIVKCDNLTREMAKVAGVEEKQVGNAVKEAAEHIKVPGQSRWVKAGGKTFKFVGKIAGPAGLVISAKLYSDEAADIEQRFERGELTREQADNAQAKLAASTTVAAGGGLIGLEAGAVIGSFICPGPGTVIGGIVGAVGGLIGAEVVMAATGLADALAEYLRPGVETIRKACSFVKEKGIALTLAAREHIREWIGPENYNQSVAALDSAATWIGQKASRTGTAIKDAAVAVKDKTVEAASAVSGAVSDRAAWTWRKAQSGWSSLRAQFE